MLELPTNHKDYKLYEATDLITHKFHEIFSVKDKLIIELTTQKIFHGEFLEGGKNRIDLINVEQLYNPNKLSGTYSFYRNEIATIRHLKLVKEKIKPVYKCDSNIKLDADEYYRLKEMYKRYILIEDPYVSNPKYSEAIERLSKVEQIGIAAPGIIDRRTPLSLLILSTWQEVFIFDILQVSYNNFCPEIKKLLESKSICKVVYRGSALVDILQRNYHVKLKYIFDTQVVDVMIEKGRGTISNSDSYRNISECLNIYLNFPPILSDAVNVKPEKWKKRPLKESKLIYASQLATYLILLKETMTEILFADFNQTIDNFCDYYDNITSDFEFSEKFYLEELTPDMQNLIAGLSLSSLNIS